MFSSNTGSPTYILVGLAVGKNLTACGAVAFAPHISLDSLLHLLDQHIQSKHVDSVTENQRVRVKESCSEDTTFDKSAKKPRVTMENTNNFATT